MSDRKADKVFVDSNIFLYTLDRAEEKKRQIAKKKLAQLIEGSRIVISTQVLNEVFVVATRKLGIDPVSARQYVQDLNNFDVVFITPEIVELAMDCSILQKLNYWDSLMVAAADSARCSILWTEDLSHGQVIKGVEVENPFA